MEDNVTEAIAALVKETQEAITSGDHEGVLTRCDAGLSIQPDNLLLHAYKSAGCQKHGRSHTAVTDAEWCVENAPGWAQGYYRRAAARLGVGYVDEALQDIRRAIELEEESGVKAALEKRLKLWEVISIIHKQDALGLQNYLNAGAGGVNARCPELGGNTLLHTAAEGGWLEGVKQLVIFRANLNTMQQSGSSPLHLACRSGFKDVTEYLLHRRGTAWVVNREKVDPLDEAKGSGHQDIIDLFCARGVASWGYRCNLCRVVGRTGTTPPTPTCRSHQWTEAGYYVDPARHEWRCTECDTLMPGFTLYALTNITGWGKYMKATASPGDQIPDRCPTCQGPTTFRYEPSFLGATVCMAGPPQPDVDPYAPAPPKEAAVVRRLD